MLETAPGARHGSASAGPSSATPHNPDTAGASGVTVYGTADAGIGRIAARTPAPLAEAPATTTPAPRPAPAAPAPTPAPSPDISRM